jgi:hypothetical protein
MGISHKATLSKIESYQILKVKERQTLQVIKVIILSFDLENILVEI